MPRERARESESEGERRQTERERERERDFVVSSLTCRLGDWLTRRNTQDDGTDVPEHMVSITEQLLLLRGVL